MAFPEFVLASASPARLQLLRGIGIEPNVQPSDFDESSIAADEPGELVQQLAAAKAMTVAQHWQSEGKTTVVLGCDSVLVVRGEVHGKPRSVEEAIARWQSMRGHYGDLLSGHALVNLTGGSLTGANEMTPLVKFQSTRVHFANVSDAEIRAYIATAEPMQCAGCFTLEGRGGAFIEKIEGCYSNVIGLSLPLLRGMLTEQGYSLVEAW